MHGRHDVDMPRARLEAHRGALARRHACELLCDLCPHVLHDPLFKLRLGQQAAARCARACLRGRRSRGGAPCGARVEERRGVRRLLGVRLSSTFVDVRQQSMYGPGTCVPMPLRAAESLEPARRASARPWCARTWAPDSRDCCTAERVTAFRLSSSVVAMTRSCGATTWSIPLTPAPHTHEAPPGAVTIANNSRHKSSSHGRRTT